MKINLNFLIPAALLLFFGQQTATYANSLVPKNSSLSVGYHFSNGKYENTERTLVHYIPLSLAYRKNLWRFKLTGGWVNIQGPGTVETAQGDAENRKDQGLADTYLSISRYWQAPFNMGFDFVGLQGKLKIPTASDEKRLGSGGLDWKTQLTVTKKLGLVNSFAYTAYKLRHDPNNYGLNNTLSFGVGGQVKIYQNFSIGGRYFFQQAATDESQSRNELGIDLIWRINKQYKIHSYSMTGLTSGSADLTTGIQLTVNF